MANPVGFFCMKLTLTNLCFKGTTFLPCNGCLNIVNARVLNNLETVMPPEMGSSFPCYTVIAGVASAEPAALKTTSLEEALPPAQSMCSVKVLRAGGFLSSFALDERVTVTPVAQE